MSGYLTEQLKIIRVSAAVATGTTTLNGTGVDMQANGGWDGVVFVAGIGTAAAGNLMKAQQSDDDGSSDAYSDLAGSANVPAGTETTLVEDIQLPRKRYVRPSVVRGTTTTLDGIWAILYRGKKPPLVSTVNATSAQAITQLYHPDEGTA